jgi:transposase
MGAPRKYPLELRERAVRLVFESGRPVRRVARDLGVHHEALRTWVRQAEADTGRRRDLLTSDERDELKRLRKESAELKRANAIPFPGDGKSRRVVRLGPSPAWLSPCRV